MLNFSFTKFFYQSTYYVLNFLLGQTYRKDYEGHMYQVQDFYQLI